jgi:hypothetical protein
MRDCILALGLDRGRAQWGRSALLSGVGYPDLTKGNNSAAILRVGVDRSHWPKEAWSEPAHSAAECRRRTRLIEYVRRSLLNTHAFIFHVFALGLFELVYPHCGR